MVLDCMDSLSLLSSFLCKILYSFLCAKYYTFLVTAAYFSSKMYKN